MDTPNDQLDRNQIINEMITALKADIEYLNQEGGSQISIKNGQFLSQVGEQFLYQFDLELFQDVDENADIEVRIGRENVPGKIYSIDEKSVQLALENYFGGTIGEAKLIISNSYLLKLLCDRLEESKGITNKLSNLSELILTPSKASIGEQENFTNVGENEPNQRQDDAIKLALGSEVSYIWGPPGTGKTTVIVPIIKNLLDEGKSILLISHTNLATDRALRAFLKGICKKEGKYYPEILGQEEHLGKYIRIGKISDELNDFSSYVDIKKIAEEKVKPLNFELERINKEIHDTEVLISYLEQCRKKLNELEAINNKIPEIKNRIEGYDDKLSQTELEMRNLKDQFEKVSSDIQNYQESGFLKRLLSGTNLDTLTNNKSTIIRSINTEEKNLKNNTEWKNEANIELKKLQVEVDELSTETNSFSLKRIQNELEPLEKQTKFLSEQKTSLQKNIDNLLNNLTIEAKLIVTTLSNCYVNKGVLERTYDCVIIDEASMAPIPALFYAAGLAKTKVVVVGDFCQLPPIAKHKILDTDTRDQTQKDTEILLIAKWLKDDIYKYSQTKERLLKGDSVPWLRQLNIQYRMDPDISDVVNEVMYKKFNESFWLVPGQNTVDRKGDEREKIIMSGAPLPNSSVGIYSTDKKHSFPYRTKSGSYYNLYQALFVASLAQDAVNSAKELDSDKKISIGIITPFRPQANLIQKMIEDRGLKEYVQADTVHRFQGEEKDIIIFDLVTAMPTKLTDDGSIDGDDEKLMNVAFSRAKLKCILVADVDTVLQRHSQSSAVRKYINYCVKRQFPIIKASEVFNGFTNMEEEWLGKIYGLTDIKTVMGEGLITDQNSFYQAFLKDVIEAEKEVIIDSPFVTKQRVEQMVPIIKIALDKGVKIFILTRIPEDQESFMQSQSTEALSSLEKLGVVVLPFKGYPHRKIAIIDRKIFWNGSLNILSQRESQEMMIRTEGASTCEQILSFLRFDKNVGKKAGENQLEHCEFCNSTGSWYWTDYGRFGLWTYCLTGGHKKGKPPKTVEEIKKIKNDLSELKKQPKDKTKDGIPICPSHKIAMVLKKGRFGDFWGCPKYPHCRITDKILKNKHSNQSSTLFE